MKFRPGYLALAPLAPLGAAVAHAALTPRRTSGYQPQPDPDRAMAYAEKLSAIDDSFLKTESANELSLIMSMQTDESFAIILDAPLLPLGFLQLFAGLHVFTRMLCLP